MKILDIGRQNFLNNSHLTIIHEEPLKIHDENSISLRY